METAGPEGTAEWEIEVGPASNMVVLGMTESSVATGEHVVITARPSRSPSRRAVLGWLLTKDDGSSIPLHVRAVAADTPPGDAVATSIAGNWVPRATDFSALSFAAREWPLTDAGRAAITATADARRAVRAACVPFGPPALMALPAVVSVDVSTTVVTFRLDTMGVERIVHLDQAAHPANLEPAWLGHSIGRWEGSTLVVDTAGFSAHPEGYAFDLPSSASKHIVERFALSADGRALEYEAIVDDRDYLNAPISHRSVWDFRPNVQPSGLPCDRDIARRFVEHE
jgi:hypothetical protein